MAVNDGGVISANVTLKVVVFVFPFPSSAVSVMVCVVP